MELLNYHEQFNRLLTAFGADTERAGDTDISTLEQLLERYPFSQTLHFMYAAHLKNNEAKFRAYLPKASLYAPQRDVLYNAVHHPDQFIYISNQPAEVESTVDATVLTGVSIEPSEHFFEIDNAFTIDQHERYEEENAVSTIDEDNDGEQVYGEKEAIAADNDGEKAPYAGEVWSPILTDQDDTEMFSELEEDVENTGIADDDLQTSETDLPIHEPQPQPPAKVAGLEKDKLIGSIAGTDFFAFAKSAVDPLQTAAESERVSKYNDDEMPFTFLWWLNKTRKEHAETYQPYAEAPATVHKPVADLNHQIIENIFHLQTPFENSEIKQPDTSVRIEPKKKENYIIERFIQEEPQIKPLQSEKIDTENKARKSAEDANDVVSETLARIYIDQMLYHKAIDTYKKLSLKYPEKSTYFADRIRAVEKKTN